MVAVAYAEGGALAVWDGLPAHARFEVVRYMVSRMVSDVALLVLVGVALVVLLRR